MATKLNALTLDELDERLFGTRKAARSKWPYTTTSQAVRAVEREYERRGKKLPENRKPKKHKKRKKRKKVKHG